MDNQFQLPLRRFHCDLSSSPCCIISTTQNLFFGIDGSYDSVNSFSHTFHHKWVMELLNIFRIKEYLSISSIHYTTTDQDFSRQLGYMKLIDKCINNTCIFG